MKLIQGTYAAGKIALDQVVDWPDGARVSVVPPDVSWGLVEADWPDSAENRTSLVAKLEGISPLELTAEDEKQIAAARAAAREECLRVVRQQMGLEP